MVLEADALREGMMAYFSTSIVTFLIFFLRCGALERLFVDNFEILASTIELLGYAGDLHERTRRCEERCSKWL